MRFRAHLLRGQRITGRLAGRTSSPAFVRARMREDMVSKVPVRVVPARRRPHMGDDAGICGGPRRRRCFVWLDLTIRTEEDASVCAMFSPSMS
jgi:hypothetical protein